MAGGMVYSLGKYGYHHRLDIKKCPVKWLTNLHYPDIQQFNHETGYVITVGDPKPRKLTVEELKRLGIVGIYTDGSKK